MRSTIFFIIYTFHLRLADSLVDLCGSSSGNTSVWDISDTTLLPLRIQGFRWSIGGSRLQKTVVAVSNAFSCESCNANMAHDEIGVHTCGILHAPPTLLLRKWPKNWSKSEEPLHPVCCSSALTNADYPLDEPAIFAQCAYLCKAEGYRVKTPWTYSSTCLSPL